MLISVVLLVGGCWVNHNQKTCYWCKESIKPEAIICKWCGKNPLTPEEKQKILEEKAIGKYELNRDGVDFRLSFLENSIAEGYRDGKKSSKAEWKVVDGELHVEEEDGSIGIARVNKNGNITYIARIIDGKRTDLPKEKQLTFIKIK